MRLCWPLSCCVFQKIPFLSTDESCFIIQDTRSMQSLHWNVCETSWRALPNVVQNVSQTFCGNTEACSDVISHITLQVCTLWYTATRKCVFNILFWILPCSICSLSKREMILQTKVSLPYRKSPVKNKSLNGLNCSMYKCSLLTNFWFAYRLWIHILKSCMILWLLKCKYLAHQVFSLFKISDLIVNW